MITTKGKLQIIIAVVMVIAFVTGGTAFAIITAFDAINASNRNWCTSLEIITRNPVSKPSTGHTAQSTNYDLYQSFLQLERHYGCPIK